RDDAPGDHDARDPDARAQFFEHDVAGDFEEKIADVKDRHAGTENVVGEVEVVLHRELGDADVHAVQVIEPVEHHCVGDKAQENYVKDAVLFDGGFRHRGESTREIGGLAH